MTDEPVDLDTRRGMMAQRETEERRVAAGTRSSYAELAERRAALEEALTAAPPQTREDVLTRAIYLIEPQAEAPGLEHRRGRLIAQTLAGLKQFFGAIPPPRAAASDGDS